ncbi:MAG: hypothetical protein FGF50_08610 [Candidatus Brockarchaeota archaeon]|nr:hypothetical protein [Candidatus Brockarchaeota archaeon]
MILILLFLAWYTGILKIQFGPLQQAGVEKKEEFYYGTMTIKIVESNFYDGSAEATSSASYVAYQGHLGPGTAGVAISPSGTDFDLAKEAQGYIYMKIYAGTAHYIMLDSFKKSNPRIVEMEWKDVDLNGRDDLIVKVDCRDIGTPGQASKPVLVLALPLIDEDVSVTCDSPPDITGIGTAEVVKQITWKISGLSEGAGFTIARLWFSTNTTYEGEDIKLETLTISGMGVDKRIDVPVYVYDGPSIGDYSAWYHKPSDYEDWRHGILVTRAPNSADALYVTVNVRCKFETGDKVYVQLEFEYVEVEGTVGKIQDRVGLGA